MMAQLCSFFVVMFSCSCIASFGLVVNALEINPLNGQQYDGSSETWIITAGDYATLQIERTDQIKFFWNGSTKQSVFFYTNEAFARACSIVGRNTLIGVGNNGDQNFDPINLNIPSGTTLFFSSSPGGNNCRTSPFLRVEILPLATSSPTNPEPNTAAPTTSSPTNAPVTDAPVTNAPVTNAPVTNAPVTNAPVTNAPVTKAPVTNAPVTKAPVTNAPVTKAPVTNAPATKVPTTKTPTNPLGTTSTPTTSSTNTDPVGGSQTGQGEEEADILPMIIGGVIGGSVVALGAAAIFIRRRRRQRSQDNYLQSKSLIDDKTNKNGSNDGGGGEDTRPDLQEIRMSKIAMDSPPKIVDAAAAISIKPDLRPITPTNKSPPKVPQRTNLNIAGGGADSTHAISAASTGGIRNSIKRAFGIEPVQPQALPESYSGENSLDKRMARFYMKYDPDKLSKMNDFKAVIDRKGIDMFNKILKKRYNADLESVVVRDLGSGSAIQKPLPV